MKLLTLSAVMGAILAMGAPIPATAATTAHNVVLVPGAFTDKSSWDQVADLLRKKGFTVTEVEIPLTSLEDDVAATRKVLDAQHGATILVGHSWGGVVIGEAGNDAKVSALVYVSAFAPDKGESVTALSKSGPATPGVKAIRPDDKGYLSIDPAAFPSVVAGDLPSDIGAYLAAHQKPINHTAFDAPAEIAAWHAKPNWYVLSSKDQVLDPHAQAFFAKRIKAKVTTVEGSHASLASHDKEVAAVIEAAANAK